MAEPTTKLEEVARAIARVDEQNGGPPYELRIQDKHAKAALFDEARAAIEALREPSPAMLEAAVPTPEHLIAERADPEYERAMRAAAKFDQMVAAQNWRKLIDATLAEKE